MKKIISSIVIIAVLASMVACTSKTAPSSQDNNSAQSPASSQVETSEPNTEPTEEPQSTERPAPAPTTESTPRPTPAATVQPTQTPQASASVEPAYNVNFNIKIIESATDDMTIYQDVTSPYDYQVAITADGNALSFAYCAVDSTLDDNGNIVVNSRTELYNISVFSDVTTFTTNVQFPEILPNRAIVYTDGQGTHTLFIAQSGEDGSAIFIKG